MVVVDVDESFEQDTGPIYLIKEDGVVSEQTFEVVIQVTNTVPGGSGFQPATFDEDYSVGRVSQSFQFAHNIQKRIVPLTLFSDVIPEGTEAFLMTSTPGDSMSRVPTYLPPTIADTFVIIEDDDG